MLASSTLPQVIARAEQSPFLINCSSSRNFRSSHITPRGSTDRLCLPEKAVGKLRKNATFPPPSQAKKLTRLLPNHRPQQNPGKRPPDTSLPCSSCDQANPDTRAP